MLDNESRKSEGFNRLKWTFKHFSLNDKREKHTHPACVLYNIIVLKK